jgi:hypothetical protein
MNDVLYQSLELYSGTDGTSTTFGSSPHIGRLLQYLQAQCKIVRILLFSRPACRAGAAGDRATLHHRADAHEYLATDLVTTRPVPLGISSWLNQVELWFAKIERDVIARGVFTSVPDLKHKLMRYKVGPFAVHKLLELCR